MSRIIFRRSRAQKSGQVVIEAVGGIILFSILLAIVMSVSVYLYFQHALVTAAREGARRASLNSDIGVAATEQSGITDVTTYVTQEVQKLTGQTDTDGSASIAVTPPSQSASQSVGSREVRVVIQWKMTNPIAVSSLLEALGTDGSAFSKIPVYASATMRYEE